MNIKSPQNDAEIFVLKKRISNSLNYIYIYASFHANSIKFATIFLWITIQLHVLYTAYILSAKTTTFRGIFPMYFHCPSGM